MCWLYRSKPWVTSSEAVPRPIIIGVSMVFELYYVTFITLLDKSFVSVYFPFPVGSFALVHPRRTWDTTAFPLQDPLCTKLRFEDHKTITNYKKKEKKRIEAFRNRTWHFNKSGRDVRTLTLPKGLPSQSKLRFFIYYFVQLPYGQQLSNSPLLALEHRSVSCRSLALHPSEIDQLSK